METFNRRGTRTVVTETASIKLGLFKRLVCEVKDVSQGGARLVKPEGIELPDQFVLNLKNFKRPRTATIRWESGAEIGVEFEME